MQVRSLPKVSVLIPAFNEEKYIVATLHALIKQDYPRFEIIIANNASTDLTALLVQEFIDANDTGILIKLVHENRKGTNFARECARQAATGSLIAQLDADCLPPSNWLQKGVSLLCQKRRAAVTGPYDYFDGNGLMRFATLLSQKIIYPLINIAVQATGKAAILIGGNAFIRAQILERCGGYNTALTFYGDDVVLGKDLSRFGRVDYMPSLIQRSSSRRYKANGFWEVNKKYHSFFWKLVWNKKDILQTAETNHPR
jgi:glycosyltransferase involved in cell wall biosynthesis